MLDQFGGRVWQLLVQYGPWLAIACGAAIVVGVAKGIAARLGQFFRARRRKPVVIGMHEEVRYGPDGQAVKTNTKTGERQPFYLKRDDGLVILSGGALYLDHSIGARSVTLGEKAHMGTIAPPSSGGFLTSDGDRIDLRNLADVIAKSTESAPVAGDEATFPTGKVNVGPVRKLAPGPLDFGYYCTRAGGPPACEKAVCENTCEHFHFPKEKAKGKPPPDKKYCGWVNPKCWCDRAGGDCVRSCWNYDRAREKRDADPRAPCARQKPWPIAQTVCAMPGGADACDWKAEQLTCPHLVWQGTSDRYKTEKAKAEPPPDRKYCPDRLGAQGQRVPCSPNCDIYDCKRQIELPDWAKGQEKEKLQGQRGAIVGRDIIFPSAAAKKYCTHIYGACGPGKDCSRFCLLYDNTEEKRDVAKAHMAQQKEKPNVE